MKKAEVLDHFRVPKIPTIGKYLYVDVWVFKASAMINDGLRYYDKPKNRVQGQFRPYADYPHRRGCIGQIRLAPHRQIEEISMHESIHAAFEVSRKYRWKFDEVDREEFIAQTADYIYSQIRKRLRLKNYYRCGEN